MATGFNPHHHHGSGDFDLGELDQTPVKLTADAELDNFISRVDEITSVINSLASKDPSENDRGFRQAELLLHDKDKGGIGDGECHVTQDRSVINKAKDDPTQPQNPDEISTQAFMQCMERDAEERTANRKARKVESDKFRKKGNILFSQKDYAGALKNYNKAISLIKDSPCLYNNRALTYIRLGIFSSAVEDCDKALRLEEYSLRARMFLAKAHFLMGNATTCRQVLDEAREKLGGSVELINDYERDLFNMRAEKPFDFDLDSEKKWQAAARYEGTQFPVMRNKKKDQAKKDNLMTKDEIESEMFENHNVIVHEDKVKKDGGGGGDGERHE